MSDEFNKNCSKNVFEGEGCSITNPELGKARKENFEMKWDFYGRTLLRSPMIYDSEAERRKAMWELGRKSNPMLQRKGDLY